MLLLLVLFSLSFVAQYCHLEECVHVYTMGTCLSHCDKIQPASTENKFRGFEEMDSSLYYYSTYETINENANGYIGDKGYNEDIDYEEDDDYDEVGRSSNMCNLLFILLCIFQKRKAIKCLIIISFSLFDFSLNFIMQVFYDSFFVFF